MREISIRGHIVHNNLIIRCSGAKLPALGDKIQDQNKQYLGTVIDLIGPTQSPWAVVKLNKGVSFSDQNQFFVAEKSRKKKRKFYDTGTEKPKFRQRRDHSNKKSGKK